MFNFFTANQLSRKHLVLAILGMTSMQVLGQTSDETDYQVPFTLGVGWEGFSNNCATCHGKWASGTDKGPPLLHQYYLPDHHDDRAFYRAIMSGSRAHHWNFGDMPPVSEVDQQLAQQIIKFVRWLQKENELLQ